MQIPSTVVQTMTPLKGMRITTTSPVVRGKTSSKVVLVRIPSWVAQKMTPSGVRVITIILMVVPVMTPLTVVVVLIPCFLLVQQKPSILTFRRVPQPMMVMVPATAASLLLRT